MKTGHYYGDIPREHQVKAKSDRKRMAVAGRSSSLSVFEPINHKQLGLVFACCTEYKVSYNLENLYAGLLSLNTPS